MLKNLDMSLEITKKAYKEEVESLYIELGNLQREARELGIPISIIFEGWDASGKGIIMNKILTGLDPRGFKVYALGKNTEEELMRPFLWKFWTRLPEKGKITIFDRSWYWENVQAKVIEKKKSKHWNIDYEEINKFEKMLMDDGNIIIKFFLHIDKKEQKERFKKYEENDSTSWKVTKQDWKNHEKYGDYLCEIENMILKTDKENSKWNLIESHDEKYAVLKILKLIIKVMEKNIKENKENKEIIQEPKPDKTDINSGILLLENINLNIDIEKKYYEVELKKYQKKLRELEYEIYRKRIPVIIAYEGWDAAGKGGNIKRVVEKLDPRGYEVVPVAAPNDIEKAHHYLWRFWNKIPKAGHIAIFDRTWYGRVLVERVEGFCSEEEWKRAYEEINDMEKNLTSAGTVVLKFWLQIDKEEQLKRFKERETIEHKKWKITEEDWRNREKWNDYNEAVNEMIGKTSTEYAPWTIVEANSKYHARLKVLKKIIEAIEAKLNS